MENRITTLSPYKLESECSFMPASGRPVFSLIGKKANGSPSFLPVDEDLLSRHMLLLGGIGTGKTNVFDLLIRNIRNILTEDDIMIIFDTKGDYYRDFYRPGDIVISNDDKAVGPDGKPDYWNIFREVTVDDRVEENITEVASMLFSEKVKKSSQPFFPNAAKDLLSALMLDLIRSTPADAPNRTNYALRRYLDSFSVPAMKQILARHPDLKAMTAYIDDPKSGQTLGVVAELQQLVREVFIGNFSRKGNLSIRELVKNKGGRLVFIEYDLGIGSTLSPIYRLIIDLAIKQTLSRQSAGQGNVYFILDEFKLLPNLQHIEDGINFGRSLGARFFAGVQNVEQVHAAYGKDTADSILSGFCTNISFRVTDRESREFIKGLYGSTNKIQTYLSAVQSRGITEQYLTESVVTDEDILSLKRGSAIVGLPDTPPFLFRFGKYEA